MNKIIIFSILSIFSIQSFAFTECSRPVEDVWSSFTDTEGVWVSFSDGGGPIFKNSNVRLTSPSSVTVAQLDRFFAQGLQAQSEGKNLRVRYPESNGACPPGPEARNDAVGVWIENNSSFLRK